MIGNGERPEMGRTTTERGPSSDVPDFDTPIDRAGTDSFKWRRYQDRDVIPLWVADMDFSVPQAVLDALERRVRHPIFGYTLPPDRLTDAVRSWLMDRYGWKVAPEWLVWLPGVVSGLHLACRSVGAPGDDVLCPTPVYPQFFKVPAAAGRRLVSVALTRQGERWGYDLDRLTHALTPRTRLFLFCHPHNPTGTAFTRQELEALAAICRQQDIVICSDEIHCDILLGQTPAHIPMAAIDPDVADRTITLMAPSKTFNIPGLGFSLAVIPNPDLRRRFAACGQGILPDINILGYVAAMAAYDYGWPWLSALRRYLTDNRDRVVQAVSGMGGVSMTLPEATYLAWIDVRELGLTDPVGFFEAAGVGLSDGGDFGMAGFLRLNFGCPGTTLQRALGRMAHALNTRPPRGF